MSYADEDEGRVKKERSPSFPFISLARAVERAKAFSDAHRRNPARPAAVGETWGYAPSSSGLLQTISALKAYGLVEDIGKGSDRKIQLTDLAQKILHDTRPGAREAGVKEAAVRPRLFAEYAAKWLPQRPSDSHCLSELRLDRGFTEAAAKTFLKSFDETMIFSSLSYEDDLSVGADLVSEGGGTEEGLPMSGPRRVAHGQQMTVPAHIPRPSQFYGGGEGHPLGPTGFAGPTGRSSPTAPTGHSGPAGANSLQSPRATLPLPEGVAAIEIPASLSRKSFEALKAWTETMVSLAERNISSRWYVEWYVPESTTAEEGYFLPDWGAAKKFMAEFKEGIPGVSFRVIAPDDAPADELAELRKAGVRTF